jgi:hypothetical protein
MVIWKIIKLEIEILDAPPITIGSDQVKRMGE